MFEEYAKIAFAVDACGGRVDGRKKLQKILYIAKVLAFPLREGYTLYLYGPYSEELAAGLQRMKELHIVEERELDSSYRIQMTESGKEFLDYFRGKIEGDVGTEILNRMHTLFGELNRYDPWKLEILATLFYFYHVGYHDFDELHSVVKKVKPRFSCDNISMMVKDVQTFIEKFAVP